jgi:hypothetical protein
MLKNHVLINLNLSHQMVISHGANRKHDWLVGFAVGYQVAHPPPWQYVVKFYFQEAFHV